MGPALFEKISEPELRPAALMAADTVEVCCEILDISAAELDELVARGARSPRDGDAMIQKYVQTDLGDATIRWLTIVSSVAYQH